MKFKKTRWIVIILTVAVIGAVAATWRINADKSTVPETVSDGTAVMTSEDDDYFDNARYTRTQSRDEAIGVLKSIVNNENADAQSRLDASESINEYALRSEQEVSIENQIIAKGFEDCVVFLSDESASVIVKTDGLTSAEAAQIMDITAEAAEINANVIKIIEMK